MCIVFKFYLNFKLNYVNQLKQTCGWTIESKSSIDEFVSELIAKLDKTSTKVQMYNIFKSLELISAFQGWIWTYNQLIIGKLWGYLLNPATISYAAIRLLGNFLIVIFKCNYHRNSWKDSFWNRFSRYGN
jgi:hypothetical protein